MQSQESLASIKPFFLYLPDFHSSNVFSASYTAKVTLSQSQIPKIKNPK